jgi:hypothetical protein
MRHTAGALLRERNLHFDVAARRCRAHGGDDPFNILAQNRPLLVSENDKSDFPARQVLLVPDILVGRQQKLKARGFSGRYQFSVSKPVPSAFDGFHNDMTFEGIAKRGRGSVIEEYEHPLPGRGGGCKTICVNVLHIK